MMSLNFSFSIDIFPVDSHADCLCDTADTELAGLVPLQDGLEPGQD